MGRSHSRTTTTQKKEMDVLQLPASKSYTQSRQSSSKHSFFSRDSDEKLQRLWFVGSRYSFDKNSDSDSGAYSQVSKATHINGTVVAVKKINLERGRLLNWKFILPKRKRGKPEESSSVIPLSKTDVLEEIKVLKDLKGSPFIVEYVEAFKVGSQIWIVTEFAEGGSVRTAAFFSSILEEGPRMRKYFPVNITRHIIAAIFLAVRYMHEKGIIHRDIKEENIVLTYDGIPKLCDFGLSKRFESLEVLPIDLNESEPQGTPTYIPPEGLKLDRIDTSYDTWCLGITMCSMISGGEPLKNTDWDDFSYLLTKGYYSAEKRYVNKKSRLNGQDKIYYRLGLSEEEKDSIEDDSMRAFLRKTLIYDPKDRPSVADMCEDEYLKPTARSWIHHTNKLSSDTLGKGFSGRSRTDDFEKNLEETKLIVRESLGVE